MVACMQRQPNSNNNATTVFAFDYSNNHWTLSLFLKPINGHFICLIDSFYESFIAISKRYLHASLLFLSMLSSFGLANVALPPLLVDHTNDWLITVIICGRRHHPWCTISIALLLHTHSHTFVVCHIPLLDVALVMWVAFGQWLLWLLWLTDWLIVHSLTHPPFSLYVSYSFFLHLAFDAVCRRVVWY